MKAKALCFVVVSLLFSAIGYSQNPYHFVLRWGDGLLGKPMGIALDSQGTLYVSDHFLHRVWKFDANGQVLGFFGSYGSGNGQFKGPYSLAIDAQDNVYVAEFINHRVQKLDTNGNFIAKWGSYGTGDGQFNGPAYIATGSDGSVYVTERWPPDRVQKFDADGNFVAKWGSFGTGAGQFWTVGGIGIDPFGFVYATSHDRVLKFDADGRFITMWGSEGYGNGQFVDSYGVAIDHERNAYAVDGYNVARVQKFAPLFTYNWEGFFRPINNAPAVNSAKAGQAIPVKWRLTDKNGSPVSDPASLLGLTSVRVDCGTLVGVPASMVDELARGSAVLEYLGDGCWQYNWKTSKAYAGQCRTLKLTFNDYCVYSATFSFK